MEEFSIALLLNTIPLMVRESMGRVAERLFILAYFSMTLTISYTKVGFSNSEMDICQLTIWSIVVYILFAYGYEYIEKKVNSGK